MAGPWSTLKKGAKGAAKGVKKGAKLGAKGASWAAHNRMVQDLALDAAGSAMGIPPPALSMAASLARKSGGKSPKRVKVGDKVIELPPAAVAKVETTAAATPLGPWEKFLAWLGA